MDFLVVYVSRHAMEPSPDLLMAGMVQDLSQSVVAASMPMPIVLHRVSVSSTGGLLALLKKTAFHHSGVTELSAKPDNSQPGVKSLVWHTFYSGANVMGCLSLWENRVRESKGYFYDSKYCQLIMEARYWGILSDCQDYAQLQQEMHLVRASAKRWEVDCIAEATRAARLAAECQDAQIHLSTQQQSLDSLRTEVHKYVSQFNSLREEYSNMLVELTTVKAALEDKETDLYHANKEIERLRRIVSSDSTSLQNAKDEILVLKRALSEYAHTSNIVLERRPSQAISTQKNSPIAVGSLASQILSFDRAALKHVSPGVEENHCLDGEQ